MVRRSIRLVLLAALLAGSGCAALSSDPNTRTPGSVLDDQIIEGMVKREIWKADPDFNAANLVVVSFNGVLLLTGQVPSEELRDRAESIATGLEKVSRVHNELEIGAPTSMVARANDGWLTTKVKAKMVADAEVMARKLKVVTENGVVYLMGIVTREEADRAVELTASVFGVQKIVKVFEYV